MAKSVDRAVAALRAGGVIAYPTEAVWGLGCDPLNQDAVARLFELKQRPTDLGVLLIGASFEQVQPFIGACPDAAIERARASWPGPHTWVFPSSTLVPPWISGRHPGIGLRVSDHPVPRAVCTGFGAPMVSTSANVHGHAVARNRAEVEASFGLMLDAIVDGELGGLEQATPIRDAITGEWLRG
ncbi:L-threonylcarbamoyladenylate synthase [Dokdonella sp.]|uniref:L-threonylcarbamoyladenylate synthase n=1 Tax=Dokdonella sp. TaxID=2291710 RepID=UPI003C6A3A0F